MVKARNSQRQISAKPYCRQKVPKFAAESIPVPPPPAPDAAGTLSPPPPVSDGFWTPLRPAERVKSTSSIASRLTADSSLSATCYAKKDKRISKDPHFHGGQALFSTAYRHGLGRAIHNFKIIA